MSDLSWLNPTPHAIAVYASRPLSPVATQHSLPSGRYPLLGPDFHRLDRTSLRLAHSLDHLVGNGKHAGRRRQAERLRRFEIEHEFELGRLQHRQIGGFGALENPAGVGANLTIHVSKIDSITHQAASRRIFAILIDGGYRMASRQSHQLVAARVEKWIGCHCERGNALLCNGFECRIDLVIGASPQDVKLHTDRTCRLLRVAERTFGSRKYGIYEKANCCHLRH